MLIFKFLLIILLFIELAEAILIKFNIKGLQDKLYDKVKDKNVESYIKHEYPNRAFISSLILFILAILAIV